MKISYYISGVILLLSLTQCAAVQEMEAPLPVTGSFEVVATPSDTRTVNSGMSTLWENGDRFSLFHAAAGGTSYVSDGAFTVDNPETGHARGDVASLGSGSFDWYLVYPYAQAASPASVPVTIGSAADGAQVQAGSDSRAHLAGPSVPLTGHASRVVAGETPVLSVAPAVSVIAVKVTNPGADVFKVTSVRFKAPEEIVGTFRVDATGSAPVYTAVSASDEAVLNVEGSSTLLAGESATFYLAIKPFTARSGSRLYLTVNEVEKSVTLSAPTTFSPGKIKTLNLTVPESEPPVQTPYYFKRVTQVVSGHKYIFVAPDKNANDSLRMACALPEGTSSGRMGALTVVEEENVITLYGLQNAFTFFETEDGWTIRQADGRYVYNNNNDNVFVGTTPNSGYWWTVSFDEEDGRALVTNRNARRIQYNPTTSVRKFQIRQTSSSVGANPWLYELQNDDEAKDDLLRKTVPGVYDYNGTSWIYEDGTWQTSVRTSGSTLAFRLYEPAEYVVVQLTGIPASLAENDRFDVRLVRYVKQVATHSDTLTVTAVKVEDGKAWLMADGGAGFLIYIQ